MRPIDLSIIVVNWNSVEFCKECVESIRSSMHHQVEYEIIIVDNASKDDSCRILSEAFPSIKLIASDHNIGFARANNLGVDHSRGERILFLNPDTKIIGDAILRMMSQLDSHPEIGAIGCKLLNRDLTLQISCVQALPNLTNQIFGLELFKRHWPELPIWGMQALYSKDGNSLKEVQAVSGACLMIKREIFEKVGRFSTEYFMYAEEMDLCCKVRRAGWKVCYVSDAQVVHYGGESTRKQSNGFADVMMRESLFKFMRKFRGNAYAGTYRVALLLSALARLLILAPLLVLPGRLVDQESVRFTFFKWRKIASWALAMEGWCRQFGQTQTASGGG